MRRTRLAVLAVLPLLLVAACGGDSGGDESDADAPAASSLDGLTVSGDFDTELPAVRRFLAQHQVGFLTYLKQDDDMRFIDGLDPRWSGALPATLVYDRAGRVRWFHEGKTSYDSLKTRIDEVLAAIEAKAATAY